MEYISCIIDFDGFHIGGNFVVREFGYVGMNQEMAESIRYDLRPLKNKIADTDWKTIRYVTRNISGLTLFPTYKEPTIPISKLYDSVTNVYQRFKKIDKTIVAYKGGHVEKDVLTELGIHGFNLEIIGCPKYNTLCNSKNPITCGYHQRNLHCPLGEVTMFKNWLVEQMQNEL